MKRQFPSLLIMIGVLAGCSPNGGTTGGDNPPAPKGKMEFKLTDDPGRFAYFKIDISSLEYNVSDDPAISTGWVDVPLTNKGIIDIIQYSNGREMPLGSLELLPVTVKQVRLKLGTRNSFAVWSGPVGGNYAFFDMALHSSIANGLIIPFKINVQANGTNRIYFDFDAVGSLLQTGSTTFELRPSLRLFEAAKTAAIEGTVLPAMAKPYVRVIYLNHTSQSDYYDTAYGYPDVNGHFKIIGLTPSRSIPDSVASIQKVEFFSRSFSTPAYQPQEKQVQLLQNTVINIGTTTLIQ